MFSNKRWTIARRGRHNRAMGLILVLIATILSIPAAIAGDIRAVEIGDREVTLRFADVVAGASAFVLAGPDRIALDILGADPGRSPQGSGLVSAVRQGRPAADTARVVLDLARPAVVTDARFAADGRSLSLRLRPVSADEFERAAKTPRTEWQPPLNFRAKPPEKRYSVTVPIGAPKPAPALPKIEGPNNPRLPLVVIDAGHGGHDPGAISPHSGKREGHHARNRARDPRRSGCQRPRSRRAHPLRRPLSGARGTLWHRAAAEGRPVHFDPRRRGRE